jgi:hypothetical protein
MFSQKLIARESIPRTPFISSWTLPSGLVSPAPRWRAHGSLFAVPRD